MKKVGNWKIRCIFWMLHVQLNTICILLWLATFWQTFHAQMSVLISLTLNGVKLVCIHDVQVQQDTKRSPFWIEQLKWGTYHERIHKDCGPDPMDLSHAKYLVTSYGALPKWGQKDHTIHMAIGLSQTLSITVRNQDMETSTTIISANVHPATGVYIQSLLCCLYHVQKYTYFS